MPKIINSVDLKRMQHIEGNKEKITLEYLEDQSKAITNMIADLFFQGKAVDATVKKEGQDKLKLLNHTIALPYKIATVKAKFAGKPMTNLEVKDVKEQVISYVYGGFSVFAIDQTDEDGKPIINKYNPEQYIKGIEYDQIVTYLQDEKNNNYAFVKEFLNDNSGIVRNKLYKIIAGTAGLYGNSMPLDTLDQTAHLEEEDNFETNNKLLYVVNDYKIKNDYYGTPQIDFVQKLIDQLNIELVNVKDQFLKHLQAKLAIQGLDASKMPKDAENNIDIRAAEAIFIQSGANAPEYIQNKNELLKDAIQIIDFYIKQIAVTLSVPLELVGQNGQTGTESTESKLLRYSDFVKDIEEIQNGYKEVFEEMFEVVTDIYSKYTENEDEKEFYCIYDAVMPKDGLSLANELNIAVVGGFLSMYTATKRYTGLEGKELEEELQRIETEQARSVANTDIF